MVMEYFYDKDLPLIEKITKVKALRTHQPRSLLIEIDFCENDYFTNKKLGYTVVLKEGTED
jgi:hypothetical protein